MKKKTNLVSESHLGLNLLKKTKNITLQFIKIQLFLDLKNSKINNLFEFEANKELLKRHFIQF